MVPGMDKQPSMRENVVTWTLCCAVVVLFWGVLYVWWMR